MSSRPFCTTVPFPEEEDAAAELFRALWERLGLEVSAAFLDSSDHARTPAPGRSRYSILAFSAAEAPGVNLRSAAFDWLADHWQHPGTRGAHDAAGSLSPFQLGWIGWIGYEDQARLFAAVRAVVVDHHLRTAEIQSAAKDDDWEGLVRTEIAALGQGDQGSAEVELSDVTLRDSRPDYLSRIRAAQAQIREGNSYEICLTTAVNGTFRGSPWEAYRLLRERNRSPFTQFQHFPAVAGGEAMVVLSTSPERFASITDEGTIRSEPIKGTRGRGATPEEDAAELDDLRTHPKDRAENVMIADLVRNDLSIHAEPGSLRTERLCAVETYPSVHQMVSTISARLEPEAERAWALADAFPPGSMTGAPKGSTMTILADLESGQRGPYSGAAGWFSSNGACDLSVLIRTVVLSSRDGAAADFWDFHLGLGGAITSDSTPQEEWREIMTKSRGVLEALGAEFPAD